MPRYFIKLAYKGTNYAGWQSQPNANTIQAELESALSKILSKPTAIVGCGRTDAGVHASNYFAHFDMVGERYPLGDLAYKINSIIPSDISIGRIAKVHNEAHARFDANSRSYIYKLSLTKNPFAIELKYKFDQADTVDFELLSKSVAFLVGKNDCFTFCKTQTDVNNYICEVFRSEWQLVDENEYHYHISANRFLRGMVRLIVGMSLNIAMGRIELDQVKSAFKNKERLIKAWSVPAQGLYLSDVQYPFEI